jgi:hypothetical protein
MQTEEDPRTVRCTSLVALNDPLSRPPNHAPLSHICAVEVSSLSLTVGARHHEIKP